MKIYFTADRTDLAEKKPQWQEIIRALEKNGHEVFSPVLSEHLPPASELSNKGAKDWYKEWSSYIKDCEVVVAEGSYPSSIDVGFEIGLLVSMGKPVILLFQSSKDPVYINQLYSDKLIKSSYNHQNLKDVLRWCFEELNRISSQQVTLSVPAKVEQFLRKVEKQKGLSRSDWVTELIEQEMTRHSV